MEPTCAELDAVDDALGELARLDPAALCDRASIVRLEQARARLEAIVVRAVAAFETSGAYGLDGARTASAWIATKAHLPVAEAKRQARLGRALRELRRTEASFVAGAIGTAQVAGLAALLARTGTREAVVEHEELLVDKAEELRFFDFKRALDYFEQLADPDGVEEEAEAVRDRREAYLSRSLGGIWLGKMTLDPIAGAIVAGELDRLERAGFEADWAEAKRRLGREPHKDDLSRSPAQRRADALVEMARRSAALPGDARYPAPLVSVLVDFPTMMGRVCELADGTVVTPGSLLPYLDEALVERAVWKGRTRVEVGARTRLFLGATRRAIELRDRVCQHPYCEEPAGRCEVDHIVPASDDGPTTQENGRLACQWHNRLRVRSPESWPREASPP